jgi:murein DD-endopeptidase MepM/ murein hydrolase activator NlpD
MKKGTRVRQGQVIAYVGSSGLATGPHLHYEFRVNGVHRNPLTVSLPKADSIPAELLPGFLEQTSAVLAQLDRQEGEGPLMIALRDENPLEPEKLPENY